MNKNKHNPLSCISDSASILSSDTTAGGAMCSCRRYDERWPTFEEILQRLHREGIYLHPHQLAEFFLAHGLPVNLRYVPDHLRQRAILLNENYQGDMASVVEDTEQPSWDLSW
jgi:hypothetical protein